MRKHARPQCVLGLFPIEEGNEMKPLVVICAGSLLLLALAACKKEESLTQKGDINLAGCEVPAGLTPAEAEAQECAPNVVEPAATEEPAITAEPVVAVPDNAVINEELARQAFLFGNAQENVDARHIEEGDINGDGVSDKAVLFMLDATNGSMSYSTHLAAFVREGGGLRHVDSRLVAGYGEAVEELGVQDGMLMMKILVQGPDDATCCPTMEKKVSYLLHNEKWIETRLDTE